MIDYYVNNASSSAEKFLSGIKALSPAVNDYQIVIIVWNLLLFLPIYVFYRSLESYWQKNRFARLKNKIVAAIIFFLWLLFAPNAAYVIFDARHLASFCLLENSERVCVQNTWQILFFFAYAVLGWIAMVYFLNQMKILIKRSLGDRAAFVYSISIIPLIALGVLLGLVNRWNSWELFIHPILVVKSALAYFVNPAYFKNWLLCVVLLQLLYWLGNRKFNI